MGTEGKRHDLYNGLVHVLGPEQADTLMSYLPSEPAAALATRSDVVALGSRMGGLEMRMDRFEDALAAVNQRLDRLFHTMLAGLLGMIGAAAISLLIS